MSGQLALSSALLYVVGRRSGVWEGLPGLVGRADPAWAAAGLAVALVSIVLGIVRWGVFLHVQEVRPGWKRVAYLATVGRFIDLFLFGTAGGDTYKVVALSREHRDRKAAVLLAVLSDRFSGLVALVVLAVTCTLHRWDAFAGSPWSRGLFWFAAAVVGSAALLLVAGSVLSQPAVGARALARAGRFRPRVEPLLKAWARFCRSWRAALAGVGLSLAIYLTYFATFYCAARALATGVSLADVLTVMPVVDVVSTMPVSVSGVGVREGAFQELLGQVAGVPAESAVAVSLAGFGFTLVWVVLGGLAAQIGLIHGRRACTVPPSEP